MDLVHKILEKNGKNHWISISKEILEDDHLDDFINLFMASEDPMVIQRAANIFMTLVNLNKNVFYNYQSQLVEKLEQENLHLAQHRNILRLFERMFIREEIEGRLLNMCFQTLENTHLSVAIRVYAMKVAYKIGQRFPEILPELKTMIHINLQMNSTAAFKNSAHKILKEIS